MHPDVVEFEPGGASYKVDDIREKVIPEAHRSPVEGERKVLLLFEAEKLSRAAGRRRERVAEDARGTAGAHGHRARVVECRRPAADDPVALPAHRLRSGAGRHAARRARARRHCRAGAARSPRRSRAASSRVPARSPGPLANLRALFAARPSRLDGTGATALAVAEQLDAAVSGAADAVAAPPRRRAGRVRRGDGAATATRTATRSACGAASTSGTSAKCAAPASISCSKASPRSRSVYRDVIAAPAPAAEHRPAGARAHARAPRPRRSTRAATRARRSRSTRRASCASSRSAWRSPRPSAADSAVVREFAPPGRWYLTQDRGASVHCRPPPE